MAKKKFSFFCQEEVLVSAIILTALVISFSPFIYEILATTRRLPESRYPLLETEFPPDQRVYLSRMRQGYEGKWLVKEKYTSEPHQGSLLHISYLLMGKATGLLGISPTRAFPVWRLIGGAFLLLSGFFFISTFFAEKRLRLAAFLLFVFAGNLPILSKTGIPFLGHHFSSFLAWYTFFDPVKRIFFLPHYTLSSGFLSLALAFFWQGTKIPKRAQFIKAGISAFIAGIILPQTLMVVIPTTAFVSLMKLANRSPKKGTKTRIKNWTIQSAPFWFLTLLALTLIIFSLSYFPWKVHSSADLTKRDLPFNCLEILSGLGVTGLLGVLGGINVLLQRRKIGYLSALWLLVTFFLVSIFTIFPISNSYRPLQIDLHLPLAVTSVVLVNDLAKLSAKKRKLIFRWAIALILLPSLLVWLVSLKAQKLFVDAKIGASYPLIPQKPYVVYPEKTVMEAIFWLGDRTDHQEVVLAAETLGSMIPAYAGNTVYLGHGNQTVDFEAKNTQMKRFYQGKMTKKEIKAFLNQNRIKYIFFGPEEKEIGDGFLKFDGLLFEKVFEKENARISKVLSEDT